MRAVRLVAVLILSVIAAGCDRSEGSGSEVGVGVDDGEGPVNLLLITMDTTRADRIGCYGYETASTPVLDKLAQSGARFTRAYSQVPITLPSHAVMLTGTYPPENGVRDNGRHALGPGLPTLAAIFRQHGYRTGAFVAAAVLHSRYGLNRGFDEYKDEMVKTPASPLRSQISGDLVCDRALAWLNTVKAAPFMCWVHFFDPHTPHQPPTGYGRLSPDPYDGEIAFMDANIGRLIDWLEANHLASRTMVVAVADHGESLGEHNFQWHSLLVYESIMRVPLIVSLPGSVPAGVVCNEVVETVDITPTILEVMEWPALDALSGRSLVPVFRGEPLDPQSAYSETDYPYNSFGWSPLRCIVQDNWKYIRAPQPELYDLQADPGEINNLAAVKMDVADALDRALAEREAGMHQRASGPVSLDADDLAALRSLGYVGNVAAPVSDDVELKNPKDMVDVAYNYRLAEAWLAAGRVNESIDLLEQCVARSPESFVLVHMLGKALAEAKRMEESQVQLMEAVAMFPGSADAHADLAVTLGARARYQQAADECRKALAIQPDHEKANQVLKGAMHLAARQEAQIEELREQLKSNPKAEGAALKLANLLAAAGRPKERIEVLRAALARSPGDPGLSAALGWVSATAWDDALRDGAEALRLARAAHEKVGDKDPQVLAALAAALAETGAFEEAVRVAKQAAELSTAAGDEPTAAMIRQQVATYEAGKAYRELP